MPLERRQAAGILRVSPAGARQGDSKPESLGRPLQPLFQLTR